MKFSEAVPILMRAMGWETIAVLTTEGYAFSKLNDDYRRIWQSPKEAEAMCRSLGKMAEIWCKFPKYIQFELSVMTTDKPDIVHNSVFVKDWSGVNSPSDNPTVLYSTSIDDMVRLTIQEAAAIATAMALGAKDTHSPYTPGHSTAYGI